MGILTQISPSAGSRVTVLPGNSGVPLWSVEPERETHIRTNHRIVFDALGGNKNDYFNATVMGKREKNDTLVEDTSIAFDETNNTFIIVKPSFRDQGTIPKYPHYHFFFLFAFYLKAFTFDYWIIAVTKIWTQEGLIGSVATQQNRTRTKVSAKSRFCQNRETTKCKPIRRGTAVSDSLGKERTRNMKCFSLFVSF